jgi:RNA-directed DNA polymerase
MWLKVPVEERDENGKRTVTGGEGATGGTPQGGVISPLLANLYMNRFLKYWRMTERGKAFCAHIVNYADDFVILSCGHAAEAMEWTRGVMGRIGLTLNEQKTSIKQAWQESFDFLGYTFGVRYWWRTGGKYLAARPSKKSVARLRGKVREVLRPSNVGNWAEVRDRLNPRLRGWAGYFCYGTLAVTHRRLNRYVADRVRHFLRRRQQVHSRGTRRFGDEVVFGELGVMALSRPGERSPVSLQ